jgi:hypothetical protein
MNQWQEPRREITSPQTRCYMKARPTYLLGRFPDPPLRHFVALLDRPPVLVAAAPVQLPECVAHLRALVVEARRRRQVGCPQPLTAALVAQPQGSLQRERSRVQVPQGARAFSLYLLVFYLLPTAHCWHARSTARS